MWAVLATAASLFGVVWYLFSLATNGHVRAQAQQHPNSITYWYIKLADSVLLATLFRPVVKPEPRKLPETASGEPTRFQSLHTYYDISEMMYVRQSFTVSIDLTKSIPRALLWWIGNPFTAVIAIFLVSAAAALAAAFALSLVLAFEPSAAIAFLFVFVPALFLLIISLASEGSLFTVMHRLSLGPYLFITIDDTMILSESTWGRFASRNTSKFSFVPNVGGLKLSINMGGKEGSPPRPIFSYPRFLADLIMDDDQLVALCSRLNKLVAEARNLPKIQYDQINLESETRAQGVR